MGGRVHYQWEEEARRLRVLMMCLLLVWVHALQSQRLLVV
jgi:hypothetical protein